MSADTEPYGDALEVLRRLAAELAQIHRAKEYSQWRDWASRGADEELAKAAPFSDFADSWVFTGDGGYVVATGRFGKWAIDRLVAKVSPEEMIREFEAEVQRNAAVYREICPVFGVEITDQCELDDGIRLVPAAKDIFSSTQLWRYSMPPLPTGTCALVQTFTVSPAFERRSPEAPAPTISSRTQPTSQARETVRQRARLACLLAGGAAVELPLSKFEPDPKNLLAAGEGNQAQRPLDSVPLVPFPMDAAVIKTVYDQLGSFSGVESLARSIDRLGRSRLARNPVDRALDLGMAAEIALMHDHGSSNTEISYKIGSRAAWLLGNDTTERSTIFTDIRKLYEARSKAVHSGALTSKSQIDLAAADALVTRALQAIAKLGAFPDWNQLVLGGRNPIVEGPSNP